MGGWGGWGWFTPPRSARDAVSWDGDTGCGWLGDATPRTCVCDTACACVTPIP